MRDPASEESYRTTRSDLAGRRKRGRSVLTVRMLVVRVAWLDGLLYWEEGRVVWDNGDRRLAPRPADLARTQRILNRLEGFPISARIALGDGEAWQRERRVRLELAKRLSLLQEPDLPPLANPRRLREANTVGRLVAMLEAEALCLNPLSLSPAAVLLQCGPMAEVPVTALLQDEKASLPARCLAALVLGALHRVRPARVPAGEEVRLPESHPCLRGAYRWGRAHGIPREPGLAARLLVEEQGKGLLSRALQALESRSVLGLPVELVRELLARGEPAERVLRLMEVAAGTERLSDRLLHQPVVEAPESPFLTVTNAESRREAALRIAALLTEGMRETPDPLLLASATRWIGRMLDLCPLFPALTEMIHRGLRAARDLPPELRGAYFRLLEENHPRLWQREDLTPGFHPKHPERGLTRPSGAFERAWSEQVLPLLKLLRAASSAEIAREALDLQIHGILARYAWATPDLLALAVEIARDVDTREARYVWDSLHPLLHQFPDARSARRLLRPLLEVLRSRPLNVREHFLFVIVNAVKEQRKTLAEDLNRLTGFLPRYLIWDEADGQSNCLCDEVMLVARELYAAVPEQADAWLDQLLGLMADRARRKERAWEEIRAFEKGCLLGLAVAERDQADFLAIVRASLDHGRQIDWQLLEAARRALTQFPWLRETIVRLFPLQTGACMRLLTGIGRAAVFGPGSLSVLECLNRTGDEAGELSPEAEAAWSALLELAPELGSEVRAYLEAKSIRGESREMPPGVRRALELPQRLRRELEHLERRSQANPEAGEFRTRLENLRERLADPETLQAQVRSEVQERLTVAVAEARLAAAERLLDEFLRARLEQLVGPQPPGFVLNDDLRNAAQLTVDVHRNRKLLRRLLRAHLAGEVKWREAHPGNVAFLQALAERGVRAETWLDRNPRTFRWGDAPGGKVRLWLETDPLRILQMGNYFDTCLGLGNGNSFSTVANASELNKRVIYAADGKGRIVGRKLIAINEAGLLVGFRTYTSLAGTAQNRHLCRLFRRYVEEFASACGLERGDCGSVPRLFAEDWYDDGIVAWDEDEQLKDEGPSAR